MNGQEKKDRWRRLNQVEQAEEGEDLASELAANQMRWQVLMNSPEWQQKLLGNGANFTPETDPVVYDPPKKMVIAQYVIQPPVYLFAQPTLAPDQLVVDAPLAPGTAIELLETTDTYHKIRLTTQGKEGSTEPKEGYISKQTVLTSQLDEVVVVPEYYQGDLRVLAADLHKVLNDESLLENPFKGFNKINDKRLLEVLPDNLSKTQLKQLGSIYEDAYGVDLGYEVYRKMLLTGGSRKFNQNNSGTAMSRLAEGDTHTFEHDPKLVLAPGYSQPKQLKIYAVHGATTTVGANVKYRYYDSGLNPEGDHFNRRGRIYKDLRYKYPRVVDWFVKSPDDKSDLVNKGDTQDYKREIVFEATQAGIYEITAVVKTGAQEVIVLHSFLPVNTSTETAAPIFASSERMSGEHALLALEIQMEISRLQAEGRKDTGQQKMAEKHIAKIEDHTASLDQSKLIHIPAVYIPNETGQPTSLQLFAYPRASDYVPTMVLYCDLLDLTPGAKDSKFEGYYHMKNDPAYMQKDVRQHTPALRGALGGALSAFESGNSYPPGSIIIHPPWGKRRVIKTDGKTAIETLSGNFGWATMGLIVAGALTMPFPVLSGACFYGALASGVISSSLNIVNNLQQDEVNYRMLVMDILGIASAFIGLRASLLQKMKPLAAFTKGAQQYHYTGLGLDAAQMLILSQDTYKQIDALENNDNLTAAQRRSQYITLFAGVAMSGGMLLISTATGPTTLPNALLGELHLMQNNKDAAKNIVKRVRNNEYGLDASQQQVVFNLIEAKFPGMVTGKKKNAATPSPALANKKVVLSEAPQLQKALPDDLQSQIKVWHDSSLEGTTVRVTYVPDKNGLIRQIQVRASKAAQAVHITDHVTTIRTMQKYQGIAGKWRLARNKLLGFIGKYKAAPGSRAWEAKLEVEKLGGIIKRRTALLEGKTLSSKEAAALRQEINYLEEQLKYYKQLVGQLNQSPAWGYVAADYEPSKALDKAVDDFIIEHELKFKNPAQKSRIKRVLMVFLHNIGKFTTKEQANVLTFIKNTPNASLDTIVELKARAAQAGQRRDIEVDLQKAAPAGKEFEPKTISNIVNVYNKLELLNPSTADKTLFLNHLAAHGTKSYPGVRFNAEATLQKLKDPDYDFNPTTSKFYSTIAKTNSRPKLAAQEIIDRLHSLAQDAAMAAAIEKIAGKASFTTKSYQALPFGPRHILKYLAEVQRKTAQPDYLKMLTVVDETSLAPLLASLNQLKNVDALERAFRGSIRALFVAKYPQSKVLDFQAATAKMGNNARGELFEAWMSTHFSAYKGGKKQASIDLKTRSGEGIVPDKVIDNGNAKVVIVEFKHFLPGTSLTAKDIAKIQAYYKAAKSKTKVYNKMPIEKVEFVFSSKEAYEGNLSYFGSSILKYVKPRFIDTNGILN